MKRKNFAVITALFVALLIIFGGCVEKNPSPEGEGGSDIAVLPETTAAEAKPLLSEKDKLIALTYDDGPHSQYTNRVLDILEKNGAKATFFVVGYNIDKNIETIKRAQALGCEIGNHTNDHKILTKCDTATLREQVDKPNARIKELTGSEMTLFRAPGGAFKGVTDDIGMPLIQWSIDTEDWKSKDAAHKNRTEEERNAELRRIADEVVQNAKKGDIILMHDIYNFTADLSEIIIPELTEKGFKLVTVSEMYKAYGKPLNDGKVYYNIEFPEASSAVQSNVILEAGNYKVKTKGGNLNIRIEPMQESIVIGKLSNGDTAKVIKSIPGWALVEAAGASGWVNAAYLSPQ
ncbi:MAG: polysaccharide deacetylase family protein [Clostridia bacterium]|nr:polysaccharide deacetylase family protein [Clostridia bacterium]